jgi:hypothetical protein
MTWGLMIAIGGSQELMRTHCKQEVEDDDWWITRTHCKRDHKVHQATHAHRNVNDHSFCQHTSGLLGWTSVRLWSGYGSTSASPVMRVSRRVPSIQDSQSAHQDTDTHIGLRLAERGSGGSGEGFHDDGLAVSQIDVGETMREGSPGRLDSGVSHAWGSVRCAAGGCRSDCRACMEKAVKLLDEDYPVKWPLDACSVVSCKAVPEVVPSCSDWLHSVP